MTRDELVERFTLDRVNPAPAVFDHQKLEWMNGVYLRGARRRRRTPSGCAPSSPIAARRWPRADGLEAAAPLVQEKIATLGEFEDFAGFLFHPVVYEAQAWEQARGPRRGRRGAGRRRGGAGGAARPLDAEGVDGGAARRGGAARA